MYNIQIYSNKYLCIYTIPTCANFVVTDVTGVFGKHLRFLAFGFSSHSILRVAVGFLLYSLKRDLIASDTPAYTNYQKYYIISESHMYKYIH